MSSIELCPHRRRRGKERFPARLLFRVALMAALAAPAPARASEHHSGDYRGRDYDLTLPSKSAASGVMIYLHGFREEPLGEDSRRALALLIGDVAEARGLAVLLPIATRRTCMFGEEPHPRSFCWNVDASGPMREQQYFEALTDHVAEQYGLDFQRKELIGYSNGAYYASVLFQRNRLQDYQLVGLLAGGGVNNPIGGLPAPQPELFLEIAEDDPANIAEIRNFIHWLQNTSIPSDARVRIVPGGHEYDRDRLTNFLNWLGSPPPARTAPIEE